MPSTVREMLRKYQAGEDYPERMMIREYTETTCQNRILESVAFSSEKGGLISCPPKVAKMLLDEPGFARSLIGLLEAPTVTPDGHLLRDNGYDAKTGLYCSFDAKLAEYLPSTATREDAAQVLVYLRETVFADFPFKSDEDFTAAVAFLLTAFVRRFLIKAPGFMVSATVQASGKSALVELIFRAAYGHPASASSWSDDQAEMAKHLTALLREGHSGICFDNLPFGHRVDGDEIAKVITQEEYSNRMLGENTTSAFPTNILVSMTGNQLEPVNDMATRLSPIYLEPDCENPENRTFSRPDIERWIDEHRPDVVKAVWTLLLAWQQCKDQTQIEMTPTRFPEWDEAVRKPLLWLGLPDLLPKFQGSKNDNEVEIANATIVEMLYERFQETFFEAKETIEKHNEPKIGSDPHEYIETLSWINQFRALIDQDSPGLVDAQRVTRRLRFFDGKVYDGLKLKREERKTKSKKAHKWHVVVVDEKAAGIKQRTNNADTNAADVA